MTQEGPSHHVVNARLTEIKMLIEDLEELGPVTADDLRHDRRTRHLAERELSQVIELAASINIHIVAAMRGRAPESYYSSFGELARIGVIESEFARRLQPSTGMRNVLVHEYMAVDYQRVAATIPLVIEQYSEYVRQVARWASERWDAGE